MELLTQIILKTITEIKKEDLTGCSDIKPHCFYKCNLLESASLADSVKRINMGAFAECKNLKKIRLGKNIEEIIGIAFSGCTNLSEIDSTDMNPYCEINSTAFYTNTSKIFTSAPDGTLFTLANGKILFKNKIAKPSEGLNIPETVINIVGGALGKYGDTADSNFTEIVIPDTVEMLQNEILSGQSALKKITIGKSVKKITGTIVPSTAVNKLIFRQPAGMEIELNKAGTDGTGMAYQKSSYSVDVYTDNECIKNYNWAADNVTVTLHALSEAIS